MCAFHREQAWERWTRRKESSLTCDERQELLKHLRLIADAPADALDTSNVPSNASNSLFNKAVEALKASKVWTSNSVVQRYINQWWLSCPERWARAYREKELERNINTNNGAESLNKLLKYKFLKKSTEKTLCGITDLIIERFLPYQYREYLTANVKAQKSNGIRSYGQNIPSYLQNRPKAFIQHCLVRIKNAETDYVNDTSIISVDKKSLLFEIKSSSGRETYKCSLGIPQCECWDWRRNKLPCKHMFYIFRYVHGIDWSSLPENYLDQDFLKIDKSIIEDDKETLSPYEEQFSSTAIDEEIGSIVDDADANDCDDFEPLAIRKSSSLKTFRKACISKVETLKNQIHECPDRATLKELNDKLAIILQSMDSTMLKDNTEGISVSTSKPKLFVQKSKQQKPCRPPSTEKIQPLKTNKSRKRPVENWRSRGRCGQAAEAFRESKKIKIEDDAETVIETTVVTDDIKETESLQQRAKSKIKLENDTDKPVVNSPSKIGTANANQVAARSSILPSWGGTYKTDARQIKLTNTCTIDNWLMLFQVVNARFRDVYSILINMASDEMKKVLKHIPLCRYLEAKLQLAEMNGMDPITGICNFYGNEAEMFVRHLSFAYKYQHNSECSNKACPRTKLSQTFKSMPRLPGDKVLTSSVICAYIKDWVLGLNISRCGRKMVGNSFPKETTFQDEILNQETGKK